MGKFGQFLQNVAGTTEKASQSSIAGAIGSGLGDLLSLGINAIGRKQREKRMMELYKQQVDYANQSNFNFNEAAADSADKRGRALYEQYQSPEAMVRQYEAAGLNAGLMYSAAGGAGGAGVLSGGKQGGASGAASANMQGAVAMEMASSEIHKNNAEAALMGAQAGKIQHENENLDADTDKTNAETITIDTLRDIQEQAGKLQNQLTEMQIKKGEEEINNIMQSTKNLAQEWEQKGEKFKHEMRQIFLQNQTAAAELINLQQKYGISKDGKIEGNYGYKEMAGEIENNVEIAKFIAEIGHLIASKENQETAAILNKAQAKALYYNTMLSVMRYDVEKFTAESNALINMYNAETNRQDMINRGKYMKHLRGGRWENWKLLNQQISGTLGILQQWQDFNLAPLNTIAKFIK